MGSAPREIWLGTGFCGPYTTFSGTATTATDDARLPADPAGQGSYGDKLEEVEDRPHHGDHLGDDDEDHDDHDRPDAQSDWALPGKS